MPGFLTKMAYSFEIIFTNQRVFLIFLNGLFPIRYAPFTFSFPPRLPPLPVNPQSSQLANPSIYHPIAYKVTMLLVTLLK